MRRTDGYRDLRRRPVLALLLVAGLLGAPRGAGADPARAGAEQVTALRADVQRRDAELSLTRAQLGRQEREAAQEAADIEQLKSQPASVARDLELQRRLAGAQERAERLSRQAAQRRQLEGELRSARQRLMRACDQLLADGATQLAAAERIELVRLRAAQAEALIAPGDTAALSAALRAAGDEPPPDDPQLLHERADLLRDSADKVLREVRRLEGRAEEIQRRQRLRLRAASVDEDLFAEQATSRRSGQSADKARAGGSNDVASEATPGPTSPRAPDVPPTGIGGSTPPAPPRSGLDPSTLDLLRRGDSSSDPDAKLLALRRAREELQRMAADLSRRATALDRRSEELRRRK